jgi:hypothetical protein
MPAAVSGASPMPTYARRQIVVEDEVGVYHCIARCVRRAFLCGVDPYTGRDYSQRKSISTRSEKEKGDILKYFSRLESMESFILKQLTC